MKNEITPGPVALEHLLHIIEASKVRIPPLTIERIDGIYIEDKEDESQRQTGVIDEER